MNAVIKESPKLAIVIPVYNEEETLPTTIQRMSLLLEDYIQREIVQKTSYILLVNDGSEDNTWEIITNACKEMKFIKGIRFSKNFGNQSAILAGYLSAKKVDCDAVVTIDADLQQDETKIEEFVAAYKDGYDVVCGVRNSYENQNSFKSITSGIFYKTMNMLGVPMQPNHSEYRLLSRKALDILNKYCERNIFVRGMIYDLGLKTKYIKYDIKQRKYGVSKFNFFSLTKLALSGITSLSTRPLQLVFILGAIISIMSLIFAALFILGLLFNVDIVVLNIGPFRIWQTFISGIQILCIGIIGEYIGQILLEVKSRPRYIIDEEILD